MERMLLEAPGVVGEARMVARRIRALLADGTTAASIIVAHRELAAAEAVLCEVFDDYAVPHASPLPVSLAASRAVQFALNSWRLPQEQFRFRPLSSLLRNAFFQPPKWDSALPLKAESVLRHLGVPRHKQDFLDTIVQRLERPFPILEDEHGTLRMREQQEQHLRDCREFFDWFFRRWDGIPESATAIEHLARFEAFVTDFGLTANADIIRLLEVLHAWAPSRHHAFEAAEFLEEVRRLTAETDVTPPPPAAAVALAVPESAVERACAHLFVMGLGEGTFPRFDGNPDTTLDTERDLWTRLVATPSESLTLSYAAVDAKGIALLPATFLSEFVAEHDVQRERQIMLLENYAHGAIYSAAERRVQSARGDLTSTTGLPGPVIANLRAANAMAEARFRTPQPGDYSGVVDPGPTLDRLNAKLAAKTFSPTSLERYVACPMRFFLQDVLHLAEFATPSDDVEATQAGTVIHRALRRFHSDTERPLAAEFVRAVDEDIDRTPSRVMKVQWGLERRRWQRSIDRYSTQWHDFKDGWAKAGPIPAPRHLELHIGVKDASNAVVHPPIEIDADGVTVRIGGVIDRVDVAAMNGGLGFWIIDYKTGRAANYTHTDIATLEKLQLPLYAMAAEAVLGVDTPARPLGLAYWLIREGGVKQALPDSRSAHRWLSEPDQWPQFRAALQSWVAQLVTAMRRGDYRLAPRSQKSCDYCPYAGVCRISQSRQTHASAMALPLV